MSTENASPMPEQPATPQAAPVPATSTAPATPQRDECRPAPKPATPASRPPWCAAQGRTEQAAPIEEPGGNRPQRSDKPYNPGARRRPSISTRTSRTAANSTNSLKTNSRKRWRASMSLPRLHKRKPYKSRKPRRSLPPDAKSGSSSASTATMCSWKSPAERSQGVLPLQQFEGRKPAIGESVEFDIDHYDSANGLPHPHARRLRAGRARLVAGHRWA